MKSSEELLLMWENLGLKEYYGQDGQDALDDVLYGLSLSGTAVNEHYQHWINDGINNIDNLNGSDSEYLLALVQIYSFLTANDEMTKLSELDQEVGMGY